MITERPIFFPDEGKPHFRTFASLPQMYRFMEKVRASSPFEVIGYTEPIGDKFRLHYVYGNDWKAVRTPDNMPNSWHTHPNPPTLAQSQSTSSKDPKLSKTERRLEREYKRLDDENPAKISLIDLINFVTNRRNEDLISLPSRKLLIVRFTQATETSPVVAYANGIAARREELFQELVNPMIEKIDFKGLFAARDAVQLGMLQTGIEQFRTLLRACGEKKMTPDNYLRILQEIGLPHELLIV